MKWITIEEYAYRYKVSLSSLRKKIESGQIEYQISSSKYLVKDQILLEQNLFDKEILDSPILNLEEKNKELASSLDKKNQELKTLQAEYEDLKNLVQWLEKDNQEMRYILNSLHRIDKWMKDSDRSPSA